MALIDAFKILISSITVASKCVIAKVIAFASIKGLSFSLSLSEICLESLIKSIPKSLGSKMAAAVIGPARQPLPASSVPHSNSKPEKLNDYELGWRFASTKIKLNTNIYYMTYKDQLILTGNLDDVGNPIRSNSEKSYRLGLEVEATIAISKQITVRPNITLSDNKNVDLNVSGINFGNKEIAYSPNVIAGNVLEYIPLEKLKISLLSKFVGKQFMNNIELPEAKLPDYFVNDLNVSFEMNPKSIFKSIVFSGLVNNILDKKYISNGYMYDVYPYYYPQAGINFLLGMNLKF